MSFVFRDLIKQGDIGKYEVIEQHEFFNGTFMLDYIEISRDFSNIKNLENINNCKQFTKNEKIEMCENAFKLFIEKDEELKSKELHEIFSDEGVIIVPYIFALITRNIEICEYIDKESFAWYLYKKCIYELKDRNVDDDFCEDYPSLEVYYPIEFYLEDIGFT